MPAQKKCPRCQKEFVSNSKYCTKECYWRSLVKRPSRKCLVCGSFFRVAKSKKYFCSQKCYFEHITPRKERKHCPVCGNEIERFESDFKKYRNAYCSLSCYYKHIKSTGRRKTGKLIKCGWCKKEMYVPKGLLLVKKYCSRQCSYKGSQTRTLKSCQWCKQEFESTYDQKYCSKKCQGFSIRRIDPVGLNPEYINHLVSKYKISGQQFLTMGKTQKWCCAICGRDITINKENRNKHYPGVVDHKHSTGMVRGLLCRKCNTGLGQFEDSIIFLENAVLYLKQNA